MDTQPFPPIAVAADPAALVLSGLLQAMHKVSASLQHRWRLLHSLPGVKAGLLHCMHCRLCEAKGSPRPPVNNISNAAL